MKLTSNAGTTPAGGGLDLRTDVEVDEERILFSPSLSSCSEAAKEASESDSSNRL